MVDVRRGGQHWSDQEVAIIVAHYFDMLDSELRGTPVVKSHYNTRLQEVTGRSKGSIEFKLQNISAVMSELGLPWIFGYKPLANYQTKLVDAVGDVLTERRGMGDLARPTPLAALEEDDILYLEPPPERAAAAADAMPVELHRLVRKCDPVARDARNRELGRQGEEHVFRSEMARLRQFGRDDLSRCVRWVAAEDGDGAGFDIRSFSESGKERLIEVKTTPGHRLTPFFLSANEVALSVERSDAFRIVRVYDFLRAPRAFEVAPPLEQAVVLSASQFRASF